MSAISKVTAEPLTDMPALRWRRVFDGDDAQVREVRRWLSGLLPDCTSRGDIMLVATELCTNAIVHTASGQGGVFAVEIAWQDATVRVTVADTGAPSGPRLIEDPLADHGRGLAIVQNLCQRTGVCGDHRGRLVWGDVFWDGPPAPPLAASESHEDAIRDGLTLLADRPGDAPAWYGHSTRQWWALIGPPDRLRLVTAPTPHQLGQLLDSIYPSAQSASRAASDPVAARAEQRSSPATLPVPPRHHPAGSQPGPFRTSPCHG
jgi:hypothetical protein